jgi:hypothetical protein
MSPFSLAKLLSMIETACTPEDQAFAWRGAELVHERAYTHDWQTEEIDAFNRIARLPAEFVASDADPGEPVALELCIARRLAQVREQLRAGLGFVLLRGLPFPAWSPSQCRRVTWAIANALGKPVIQTGKGSRLVDVTDTSGIESTPRQFSTSRELRLHSDPASDLMGLACVQPAAKGGESVLTSAITVHEAMRLQRPELLAELYAGFHWHFFGEGRPEDGPITRHHVPVFSRYQNRISCRYVRSPIVAGHKESGLSLSESQIAALDYFDKLAADPALRLNFRLGSGDLLWVNNLTVLHARTEFVDHVAPLAPRLLLRFWLQGQDDFRPVDPVLNYFNGGQCGIPLTGQKATYDFDGIYKDPASGGPAHLGIPHGQPPHTR